jgi:exonuclease III
MKIVSQNYRGLGNQPAVNGVLQLQKAEDPDILFLCETKLKEKEIEYMGWRLNMVNMIVQDIAMDGVVVSLFSGREG